MSGSSERLERLKTVLGSDRFSRRQLADGTSVLLDLERMRVLTLNETGTFLLEAIAGDAAGVEELEQRLTASFEVDPPAARRDIEALLADLEELLRRESAEPPGP